MAVLNDDGKASLRNMKGICEPKKTLLYRRTEDFENSTRKLIPVEAERKNVPHDINLFVAVNDMLKIDTGHKAELRPITSKGMKSGCL